MLVRIDYTKKPTSLMQIVSVVLKEYRNGACCKVLFKSHLGVSWGALLDRRIQENL